MMLDALHDSGLPKDHPAFRKALVFIQRCQMRAESNDQPYARGANDGGFIYSPANKGESKAGRQPAASQPRSDSQGNQGDGELRTYGSMTYAGFKSMLYAGLSKNDPRVHAALDWIGRHWTLDFNPNMPEAQSKEGLYYYYHTFARALAAWGEDVVKDRMGREHRWRDELVEKLAGVQREDGSWVNEADRWMEGLPALTTAYSMLGLQAAFPTGSK
jgi:squalene-hopene/tetraprenyl-beta-curcumene cyclase